MVMPSESVDILENDEIEAGSSEIHAPVFTFDGSSSDEFKILKCRDCGITPTIQKEHPGFGKFVCTLKCRCLDKKPVVADCETAVMVKWNQLYGKTMENIGNREVFSENV